MARTTLLGSAMNFAHLLGRPAARAEDDKPDDEDDKATKRGAENGEDETEEEKKKRREDEDEQDEKRREEDEDDKDERRKKQDDDDMADAKDAKATAARRRERARCASIFASKHAAARPDVAAHLAFATDLSRSAAHDALAAVTAGAPAPAKAAAAPAGKTFRDRAVGQRSPQLGSDAPGAAAADTPDGVAQRMMRAAGLATPKT